MSTSSHVVVKFHKPTPLDRYPLNTIFKSCNEHGECEIFMQINLDDQTPEWIRYGHLLEQVFSDQINNEEFLHQLTEIAQTYNERHLFSSL